MTAALSLAKDGDVWFCRFTIDGQEIGGELAPCALAGKLLDGPQEPV